MVLTWLLYKTIHFNTSSIRYKGRKIRLLIADNFARQLVGLMYRNGISDGEGMLFIFGRSSGWGIWMQNMRFPIDIVWLDGGGKVIDIKRDAQPCRSIFNCETYRPRTDSRYVLELSSGGAARHGIGIGDRISLRPAK